MTYNYQLPDDPEAKPGTIHLDGVFNGCEACNGWRNENIQIVEQTNKLIDRTNRKADAALKLAEESENGVRLAYLTEELKKAKLAQARAEAALATAEAARNALPVPEKIKVNGIDIKEGVQVLLDALVQSMDAGSGMLDYREWCAIRQVGHALGVVDLDQLSHGDSWLIGNYSQPPQHAPWPDPKAPLTDTPTGTVTE